MCSLGCTFFDLETQLNVGLGVAFLWTDTMKSIVVIYSVSGDLISALEYREPWSIAKRLLIISRRRVCL